MTRFGLIAAWLVATALTTVVAWQVVGAADDQVSDAPLTPVIAVTTPAPSSTDTSVTGNTGDPATTAVDSTTPTGSAPTSTAGQASTTTSSPGPTVPDSSSSTTTPTTSTGIPATTTAVSDGGSVTVTGTEPRVELVAVVAAPGWTYDITSNDGDRVEVRFENAAGDDIRIRCEWEDGRLVSDIDD